MVPFYFNYLTYSFTTAPRTGTNDFKNSSSTGLPDESVMLIEVRLPKSPSKKVYLPAFRSTGFTPISFQNSSSGDAYFAVTVPCDWLRSSIVKPILAECSVNAATIHCIAHEHDNWQTTAVFAHRDRNLFHQLLSFTLRFFTNFLIVTSRY